MKRKEGHHPIIFMQCGPERLHVGAKQGAETHPPNHKVVMRPTSFDLPRTAPEKLTIQEIYDLLINDEDQLLIATGRYLGEGFDDARLDTLFLTLPISWKGTLAPYAGRLRRLHYNKREVRIYDYADLRVAMLERMFKCRLGGYKGLGYKAEGVMGKGSSRQAR